MKGLNRTPQAAFKTYTWEKNPQNIHQTHKISKLRNGS